MNRLIIKKISIDGVNNAHLYLDLRVICTYYSVGIFADGKKIMEIKEGAKKDGEDKCYFVFENIELQPTCREITISVTIDGKKERVIKKKNKKLYRIGRRFIDLVRNKLAGGERKNKNTDRAYRRWIKENEIPISMSKKLAYCPSFAIVVLSDDKPLSARTNDSLARQEYKNHKEYFAQSIESAYKGIEEDYVCIINNGDVLSKYALFEYAKIISRDKNAVLVYCDEDQLNSRGKRCNPYFKADWSPDTLLSLNYIGSGFIVRRDALMNIKDVSSNHDLTLRITEKTSPKNIHHVSKILCHSASETWHADRKAVEKALLRKENKGSVKENCDGCVVEYAVNKKDMISIVIPTKDNLNTLKRCVESIQKNTTHKYEIVVINNNSVEPNTLHYYESIKKMDNITVLDLNVPFNYSYINNQAVLKTKGSYLLFMNDDTEVLQKGWEEQMLGYASQDHIGAVGAKLLYPNRTIQHCGVILGAGGLAGHAFVGLGEDEDGPFLRTSVPYNYAGVTAACLMISKKKFEEVGGFEEKLEVAFNDVDLCIKLLERGYYNVVLPQVKLLHYESLSRGNDDMDESKKKRYKSEIDFMKKKWGNILFDDPFYNKNLSLEHNDTYNLR